MVVTDSKLRRCIDGKEGCARMEHTFKFKAG